MRAVARRTSRVSFQDIKVIQYSAPVMGHACRRDVSYTPDHISRTAVGVRGIIPREIARVIRE